MAFVRQEKFRRWPFFFHTSFNSKTILPLLPMSSPPTTKQQKTVAKIHQLTHPTQLLLTIAIHIHKQSERKPTISRQWAHNTYDFMKFT